LDSGDAEIEQEHGLVQGPLKSDNDTDAIHLFAVNLQSDLEVLIYYWINKRHPQLSNFVDVGYTYTIANYCGYHLAI
jgi:hypothetical protein